MAEVPGPRIKGRGNWLTLYWFFMFVFSLGQLGGIVGGVGQALMISAPITDEGRSYNEFLSLEIDLKVRRKAVDLLTRKLAVDDPEQALTGEKRTKLEAEKNSLEAGIPKIEADLESRGKKPEKPADDKIWATIIAIATAGILYAGRYGFIQLFATLMVFSFTIITVINLFMLQKSGAFAVTGSEFLDGLKLQLPPPDPLSDKTPLWTALAAFGIIGVGASELVAYPYWCIEKGYARFTGPRDDSEAWGERARGWMRVMRWDAWCSMVVYTFATVAFYLLGAAILHRTGLNPEKADLVRTLGVMYEPVFGQWAQVVFLFGAIAVLYSTFFVANAGHSRVFTDALKITGLGIKDEQARQRSVKILGVVFPMLCLGIYIMVQEPVALVLISGIMQGIMLPMLAGAALWFRYRKTDRRILPGSSWDLFLWLSALGMLISGAVTIYNTLT
jgi:Mn2+/Fe2+ NRAMP family transporter